MFNLFPKPTNNQSSRSNNMADFLAAGSVSTKDLIAPSYVEVDFNSLKIDDRYYRTYMLLVIPAMSHPIGFIL